MTTKEQTRIGVVEELPWVESSAPSNIALIKYMGKVDARGGSGTSITNAATVTEFSKNRPTNSSLSSVRRITILW